LSGPSTRTQAVVLRAQPLRDHDVIVELLGRETGRVSAVARGARNSRRRFGGALEIGTRVDADLVLKVGRDLHRLEDCEVRTPLRAIRGDLDRIQHLAYALELAHLGFPPEAADPAGYDLLAAFVDALEGAPASHEALVLWELALLRHLGYGLTIDRCPVSGEAPDALSLHVGGAVNRGAARVPDAIPLSTPALRVIAGLERGHATRFDETQRREVRGAFSALWRHVSGHEPRSARFLGA
jgi:DNA repair protein RecO (recombination protein O)